ncbi:AAA family ATPase [Nocardioides daejeonensis]|uniref:AAA family ATPase n=1 Tax=Nocardioides daejeonensis TaxID=1046556 RepID=UPI000D7448DD|nr:AAA family ATPase [Nocardioides daejeonensis]
MTVIVDKDPAVIERLSTALPRAHGVDSAETMHAWLGRHTGEYAVVCGPSLALADAIDIAEGMRYTRPSTSVILVREEVDAEVLYKAMQSGARDVVQTDDASGLLAAIGRAEQYWKALHGGQQANIVRDGTVVTVFSPKGGVGKTTTSVNLALALADGGTRKVCLVDLDLAFGDVAITMQLFPHHTIEEAIGGEDSIDFAMVESLLTRHEQSLMVLAAPSLPDARDRVTATLVARMMRTLKREFDYVVVDTSPSFDEQTLQALDETDECVIVATLDVPTLKNVKVALETLDLLNIAQGSRHLLLNRADDAVGLDSTKVEAILGMPITTLIPSSIDVAAATNAGKPIVIGAPSHPASIEFRKLAAKLAGEEHAERNEEVAPAKQESGKSGALWRRKK